MMDFFVSLFTGGGGTLALIVGGIVAAIGALWGVRRSGAKAEKAKQAEREKEARDVADSVDNDIGAMTPEQKKEALKKWAR